MIVANATYRSTAAGHLLTTFFARCACNVTRRPVKAKARDARQSCLGRIFAVFSALQQDFGPVPAAASPTRQSAHQTKTRVVARIAAGRQRRCKPYRIQMFDETGRPAMQMGTVKWFNPTKGYGFIKPAGNDKDVFVHISAVERAGLSTLNEGQAVEYELVTGRNGKTSAENLKVT
jgi:CspA family cold shock protein